MKYSLPPVETLELQNIGLETLRAALEIALGQVFETVSVNVVQCPDLTQAPFNLPVEGFGGGASDIVDIGGVPNLAPIVDRTKNYNLADIVKHQIGSERYPDGWYLNGCGAGPWQLYGSNSEMILSMKLDKDGNISSNASKVALTSYGPDNDVLIKDLKEPKCSLLANFMVSSPQRGNVLEIICKKRKVQNTNYVTAIRESLQKHFPNIPIGLGGIFLLESSNAAVNIMRDFSLTPITNDDEMTKWVKAFKFDPPMLFQSVLVSHDPGHDLRVEHSHGWSLNPGRTEAGHYHHDIDGDNVEYTGYFTPVQRIYRVDRPRASATVV